MRNLPTTYDPKDVEERLYADWEAKGYFRADPDPAKKPFTIVMPPPNVTGQLHMGHALDNTMQDILIRFKRMQGYNALWQPGTDHASIATEVKVIEQLKKEGISGKEVLGREGFLKRAWAWKEEYGGRIIKQLKKMGSSADWQRERFTMDEGCNKAVEEVFCRLYDKNWIYKGSRIINWCPVCQTSISDAEVEHEEQAGHFWHIKYPIVGEDGFVEIATTRPETLLGDTAVAVNPEDERYTDLVGKMLELPLTGRQIPVIADAYVDKEFGTGCVKITPAHDPNDFEVGKRHNLEEINILNDDATINERGGKYCGMDRYEARAQMVKDLEELGLLVRVEDHVHNVGTHDRCHTTVEPMIKPQWFVRMKEMAETCREALEDGRLTLVPERMNKNYLNWINNIRDWCISRQLWWGHRIPAYYCDDCGETIVCKGGAPAVCPKCGGTHFHQDEDTLDTWFSSALWPFSTLGWPEETEDLKYFYPTDVLVTGYDIIFFWVIRMVFSGIEQTGEVPFHTVIFHGLVRDELGRKMSKSLGNGVDPLEVIDQYGADALRFTLVTGNAPGNDMRYSETKVQASRNFANKIWNASRFILMNLDEELPETVPAEDLEAADRWILSKVNDLVRDVTDNMEKYELGLAVGKLNDFFWDEFCDWYIEMVKSRLYGDKDAKSRTTALWTLKAVLTTALKLLHPYMPFITEEIFSYICPEAGSIMVSDWPVYKEEWSFPAEEEEISVMKEAIRQIRNIRATMNVPPKTKATVYVVTQDAHVADIFRRGAGFFAPLSFADQVIVQEDRSGLSESAVQIPLQNGSAFIPLEQLVDLDKERARLNKEKERLAGEIERAEKKLQNERFVSKAPANVVEEERNKVVKYNAMLQQVAEQLARLG